MKLTEACISRPVGTSLLAAGLLLGGAIAFSFLPIAALPQVEYPTLSVSASLPGADPATVATSVSAPLERRFAEIAGVNELTSSSFLGRSRINIQFDLDRSIDHAGWPKLPPHDLVLAAEVVEHLHASANHWLPFLQSAVAPGGHLIITTPNGVALRRRLMMLAGVHPYEKIRDDPRVPGHFREFTKSELTAYGQAHGLRLVHFEGHAHLDYPFTSGKIYNKLTAVLPSNLRDTMYLVFRNEKGA